MLIIRKNDSCCYFTGSVQAVSRKKKENKSPMPAASAGLLRFFEEETEGIKIRPELLMALAITLVVVSVIAKVFFPV
jgi:preprotein translocase subunit Sec61beta